jgi:uncharacterized membrane protein YeaQ/YmgE (transglycosylase-associated protein family)
MYGNLLLLVIIGAAAGVAASRLMKVRLDMPTAMGVGVLGALIGGLALRLVLSVGGWFVTFALALGGAMVLIWVWQQLRR